MILAAVCEWGDSEVLLQRVHWSGLVAYRSHLADAKAVWALAAVLQLEKDPLVMGAQVNMDAQAVLVQ